MCSSTAGQAFTLTGFPHSDICGSMDICSSPQLFAACHVLRRLQSPRHSPCALCNLTFFWFSRRSSLTHNSWIKSLSSDKLQNFRFAYLILDARQQVLHDSSLPYSLFSHVLSFMLDLLCSFQGPGASPDAALVRSGQLRPCLDKQRPE